MDIDTLMTADHAKGRLARSDSGRYGRVCHWGLISGFLVLLLLIAFVAGLGYTQMNVSQQRLQDLADLHFRKLELSQVMLQSARNRTLHLQRVILMPDPFERDAARMEFEQHAAEFIRARDALLAMNLTPKERALLDDLRTAIQRAVPIQQSIIDLAYSERLEQSKLLLVEQAIPSQNAILSVLSALDRTTKEAVQQAVLQAKRDDARARSLMLGLSAAAIAVGLLVAMRVIRQVDQASRLREHLATHDPLTGLPNRMLLMDRLTQALARARREHKKLGVMFIDLDGFKPINDSLGHAAGDALIRAVAGRFRTGVRAEDTVARVGGDEFVFVVGGVHTIDDLVQIAKKLIAVISRPFDLDGQKAHVGCSIGISVYPEDGEQAADLLRKADIAMYRAKAAGRGCYRLFDPAMNSQTVAQAELKPT